ncbi:uncharacterized protein [Battus philenor]|uniref:uncharacterized protein n=1 Tax=Battus philenor TaxID=42288 RepID=UPI0035CF4783
MFQTRGAQLRKPVRPRAPTNISASYNDDDKVQKERKNKYNIPKNIRYDLENALVSLCDVWFEEIKPYLVNNNVKVHVHDNEFNVNASVNNAKTDDGKQQEISVAPTCSHLDPASSSSRCELCRLLFNAASNIENAIAQAATAATAATTATPAASASTVAANSSFTFITGYESRSNVFAA